MKKLNREWLQRQAGCIGKRPLTREIAERIAKQSDGKVQPYRCKYCRSWHVGGSNGKVQDERKSQRE